jgi:hypothetical protein
MNLAQLNAELTQIFGDFSQVKETKSEVNDDEIKITVDGYEFWIVPQEIEVKSIAGKRMLPGFAMSAILWEPGSRNHPPTEEDYELGEFRSSGEIAKKIVHVIVDNELNNICTCMAEAQMERNWEEGMF